MPLKGVFQNSRTLLKVVQLLLVTLFFTAFSLFVWWLFFGERNDVNALKAMLFAQSVGLFIVPSILVAYFWSTKPSRYLHINEKPSIITALLVVLLMLAAIPFINLLSYLNQQVQFPAFLASFESRLQAQEASASQLITRFLQVSTLGELSFNILLMAIVPALGEELYFRSILQNLLSEKYRTRVAIWITAILFSAVHFQFYGFIPRLLMGALFGYLLLWSGSLWLPILAHFTNNATAVIGYFVLYQQGLHSETIDNLGTGDTLWLGILSGIVVCVGVYWLRRSLTISNASSRKSLGN